MKWKYNIIFLFFLSVLLSNDPQSNTGPWPGGWGPLFCSKDARIRACSMTDYPLPAGQKNTPRTQNIRTYLYVTSTSYLSMFIQYRKKASLETFCPPGEHDVMDVCHQSKEQRICWNQKLNESCFN